MQCTVLFRALPKLPFLPLYVCFYVTFCSNLMLMVTVIRRIELLSELLNILQHNILSGSLALQGLLQIHIPSCFLVNRFNLNNRNAGSVAAEIQEPQVLKFWSRIFFYQILDSQKLVGSSLCCNKDFQVCSGMCDSSTNFPRDVGATNYCCMGLDGLRWVE